MKNGQVVKVGTTEEPMIVYAFRKGVCPGPFANLLFATDQGLLLKYGVGRWSISPLKERCARSAPAWYLRARERKCGLSPSGSMRPRRGEKSQRGDGVGIFGKSSRDTLVACSSLEVRHKGLGRDCLPEREYTHNTQSIFKTFRVSNAVLRDGGAQFLVFLAG